MVHCIAVHGCTAGERDPGWSAIWRAATEMHAPGLVSSWTEYTWESQTEARYHPFTMAGDFALDLAALVTDSVVTGLCDLMINMPKPQLVISHSLGTVLAAIALHTTQINPHLITMGSPLWMRDAMYYKTALGWLMPQEIWPSSWHNIIGWFDMVARFGFGTVSGAKNLRAWCRHDSNHYVASNAYRLAVRSLRQAGR